MTNWIQTFTGKPMWPTGPTADMVDIEDIAHALSNVCRFNGHTDRFYSVCEHSVRVARLVPREDRLAALLHDASEAYLCDVPSPIKPLLPGYAEIEDRLSRVIAEKWGLVYPWPDTVKAADRLMLHTEAKHLMDDPEWCKGSEVTDFYMYGWEPWYARLEFMEMFADATR